MNRLSCFFLVFVAMLFVGADGEETTKPSSTAEKITLKLNLKKGDTRKLFFNMNVNSKGKEAGQKVSSNFKVGVALKVTVDNVDKDGLHTVTFHYGQFKYSDDSENIDYDSDKDKNKDKEKLGMAFQLWSALVGKSFTAKMTPQGEIKEQDVGKLSKNIPNVPGKQQVKTLNALLGPWFGIYPTKPVGIGNSWQTESETTPGDRRIPMTTRVKFTLADRKNGEAIVKYDSTTVYEKKELGKTTSTIRIDEKTGWPNNGNMTITMALPNMEMKIKTTLSDKRGK